MHRILIFVIIVSNWACNRNAPKAVEVELPNEENLYSFDFERAAQLSNVLDLSQDEDKLVFLDIGTSWCLPCQLMKEDVYTDQVLGDYFNENFINYMVEGDKGEGPDLRMIYDVKSYPTLLFLDSKGAEVARKEGAAYHTELKRLAKQALASRYPN